MEKANEKKEPSVNDTEEHSVDVNGVSEQNATEPGAEGNTAKEDGLSPKEMMDKFDEILGTHIEKLLGTKTGIESLSMNLLNLSYIILVAARETEIESFPYLPPERYTNEKIFNELTEISIDPGDDLEVVTLDMAEKGYLEIADDGRFFAQKPAITIAQLIDQIFPNMPGLNLVAYWGQMMDEVNVGRKTLELALSQFDQMLGMQGVLPKKQTKKATLSNNIKSSVLKQVSHRPKPASIKPANIFSQLETKFKANSLQKDDNKPQSERLHTETDLNKPDEGIETEISNEVPFQETENNETKNSLESDYPGEEQAEYAISDNSSNKNESREDKRIDQPPETLDDKNNQDKISENIQDEEPISREIVTEAVPKEDTHVIDDDIEKQIEAFEQELGMKCPLCNTGDIKAEETGKGKKFFRCSNKECNLISWGKPFYLTCPNCENPFLIEAPRETKTILKCPRATCHYWQKLPWESDDESNKQAPATDNSNGAKKKSRRKVRRRRVVRRKK